MAEKARNAQVGSERVREMALVRAKEIKLLKTLVIQPHLHTIQIELILLAYSKISHQRQLVGVIFLQE